MTRLSSVLVIGATGDQGAAQLAALRRLGTRAAGATRDPTCPAFPCGASAVFLDLHEPRSILTALEGVDTVFLNLPSASFSDPQHILDGFDNVLAAAQMQPHLRVIFNTSLYVAESPQGHPAHDTRFTMVERLLQSPVDATVICPVIFLDNLLRGWALPTLRCERLLRYPHAVDLPVSWICLDDLAKIMIALAEDPSAVGARWVVGGPEPLCGPQTAAELSRAWGEIITFDSFPVADFAHAMGTLFGGGEHSDPARITADLERVYRWYNDAKPSPFTVDMSPFLRRYPIAMTTVYDWACQHRLLQSEH